MKVLFLYTELADYFIKCCENLATTDEVHIVRWPVNAEAPFSFDIHPAIKVYEKGHYDVRSLQELTDIISHDIAVCSGWIDKDYLKIMRRLKGRIPTVMTSDTWWTGAARQRLMLIPARLTLRSTFSHMWVPGPRQEKFARLLGFGNHVKSGFYCCDLPRFNSIFNSTRAIKRNVPRRFIFTGRYHDFKGITDLWEAFIRLRNETRHDWELWCLGTGSIPPMQHPSIRHFGFVQPADLGGILSGAGVFVLPSRREPWGVVVQEFAAAGFPLLLSDKIGAADVFLEEGVNGYSFRSSQPHSLYDALRKVCELPAKALNLMAEASHRKAQSITPDDWSMTLRDIYTEWHKRS